MGRHREAQWDVFLLDFVRLKAVGEVNGVVDGILEGQNQWAFVWLVGLVKFKMWTQIGLC